MALLKSLKDFLLYTGPTDVGQFELLEEQWEGTNEDNRVKEADGVDENIIPPTPKIKKEKDKKSPLNVEQWNDEKKQEAIEQTNQTPIQEDSISKDLQKNRERITQEFNIPKSKAVSIRDFRFAEDSQAFIVYVDGMADRKTINDSILRPLMRANPFESSKDGCVIDYILENMLSVDQVTRATAYDEIVIQVLSGATALFVEGCDVCLVIESRGFEKRSVEQPVTENVIVGPHEAFTETLHTNLTLVRKIIKNKDLTTEILPVGKTNNSTCGMMYIDGIVNPKLVNEVKRRIESIDIDFVMGSDMLNQLIEDHPLAIFPQILTTERPDRTASFLMEGKVILIVDGSPAASAMPVTFFHMLHSSEDSFMRWQYGTLLRFVRVFAFGLAMFLPAFYIALVLYHQEMIPTELLLAIERSRENVPFPSIVEVIMMELAFELIREAGIRVPGVIGPTLGIIGALILGQAAVAANLVSPILIIIVAITGLGNFAIPNYMLGVGTRILKILFIFFAAIAGFYGISAGIFIVAGFHCSMKSFGVPFFTPIAPKTKANPDVIVRQPIWKQVMRPDSLNGPNERRAGKVVRGWAYKGKRGGKDDQ